MFKLKAQDGTNNLCGQAIMRYRASHTPPLSQRKLAQMLQIAGYDVDHHFVRRIELGERFVTDIELAMFSQVLGLSLESLIMP